MEKIELEKIGFGKNSPTGPTREPARPSSSPFPACLAWRGPLGGCPTLTHWPAPHAAQPAARPALLFPPARAPHSSAHRPTAPLARFFITARSLSHCTSAPPVSVFSLLSFLLPRASFFFPGSFLSPAAVSAARMEGHRRHPHMAGDQSRPLPFLFPLAGRPINLHADPSSSPILCPLPRATAAGENPPPSERERRHQGHPKHRRIFPRP